MLQTNARLTRITGAGTADDWDRPATAGADKWTGDIPAYYREKVDRVAGDGRVDVLVRRTAWVDTARLPAELDTDDTVALELDDGRTITGTARTVARAALAGHEAVSTTRIDLEDA